MIRVLSVLGDTDRNDRNLIAIELHSALTGLGARMRTVALAPGPAGGLDHRVPVLAPVSRSVSAVTQLRREQRWPDVVLCVGQTAARVQRMTGRRRSIPTVVALLGSAYADAIDARRAAWPLRGASVSALDAAPADWLEILTAAVQRDRF